MPKPDDLGFEARVVSDELVFILRDARLVTTLRGESARRLVAKLARATGGQRQQLLARATGNYKRGNERSVGQ